MGFNKGKNMGSFSITHWIVILAVVVLLFGAKKIPELSKGVGQGIKDFKKAIKENEETPLTISTIEEKIEKSDISISNKIIK